MKRTRRFWIASLALLPAIQVSCRDEGTPAADSGASLPEKPAMPGKGESPGSDEAFLGLTEAEGAKVAEGRGLKHRTVSIDGRLLPATRDYRPDRVNFEIEEGRIARVSRG